MIWFLEMMIWFCMRGVVIVLVIMVVFLKRIVFVVVGF